MCVNKTITSVIQKVEVLPDLPKVFQHEVFGGLRKIIFNVNFKLQLCIFGFVNS